MPIHLVIPPTLSSLKLKLNFPGRDMGPKVGGDTNISSTLWPMRHKKIKKTNRPREGAVPIFGEEKDLHGKKEK